MFRMLRIARLTCAALAVTLAILAQSAFIGSAFAQTTVERANMWERSGWDGWQAHLMIFWPVFLLLAVVGAISIGITIYREFWPGALYVHRKSPVASGHQILAERFARGEIDEGEYRTKRKALGKR